ncbi:MAG: glycosyltransferase [Rhodobacteraceae bacterium]|nr:glycosyltransferase [Paracoccaceae bacterium]
MAIKTSEELWYFTFERLDAHGGGLGTYIRQVCAAAKSEGRPIRIFQTAPGSAVSTTTDGPVTIVDVGIQSDRDEASLGKWMHRSRRLADIACGQIASTGAPRAIEVPDGFALGYFLLQRKHLGDPLLQDVPVLLCAHTPIAVIEEWIGTARNALPDWWTDRAEKWCFRAADGVITLSAMMEDLLRSKGYLTDATRVRRAANPFLGGAAPYAAPQTEAPVIGMASRMVNWKGLREVLDIAAAADRAGMPMTIELCGDTHADFDRAQADYADLFASGRVSYLGKLAAPDLTARRAGWTCQLHPSPRDNLPYAVIEALSRRLPCLISTGNGVADYLPDDLRAALVVDFGDPDAVLKAIAQAGDTRARLGGLDLTAFAPGAYFAGRDALIRDIRADAPPRRLFPFLAAGARDDLRPEQDAPGDVAASDPRLTAVIPITDADGPFERCLSSVSAASIPVRIVLACGADALDRVRDRLGAAETITISGPEGGQSPLTAALAAAETEFVTVLDPAQVIAPDYFAKAIAVLDSHDNVGFVGCWIGNGTDENSYRAAFHTEPLHALIPGFSTTAALICRRAQRRPAPDGPLANWSALLDMAAAGAFGVTLPAPLVRYPDGIPPEASAELFAPAGDYAAELARHGALQAQNEAELLPFLRANGLERLGHALAAQTSASKGAAPAIDVSIVLNVHRETDFFNRTLNSLDAAARYAALEGIRCELITVADRPDQATRDWFAGRDMSAYCRSRVIEVDNGSLGLSRNDGFALAEGTYVMTADADDLVSFNMIAASLAAARATDHPALHFPHYYLAFGMDPHLYELHPLDTVTPQAMVGYHPFVSRFFARRTDLDGLSFDDLRLSSGFAYEDWHFNLQAVAAGLDLKIVPRTAIYYRQRATSLLRQAVRMSNGVTGDSAFFRPEVYLPLAERYAKAADAPVPDNCQNPGSVRQRFLSDPVLIEASLAAARLDPAIDPVQAARIHAFTNLGGGRGPGRVWETLCRKLDGRQFQEVLIVPFLAHGGGEKFILTTIRSILAQQPDRRLLILSGQPFKDHVGLDGLPDGTLFLDLADIAPDLSDDAREMLALRVLQTAAQGARIHIKPCPFAQSFLRRFAPAIDGELVYYRFCDAHRHFFGEWVPESVEFDFMSEYGRHFTHVICDNDAIRSSDCAKLDHLADRYRTLYIAVEDDVKGRGGGASARHRIIWASRLDKQKRPDLLAMIAETLQRRVPEARIDVWGGVVLDKFDTRTLTKLPNVTMKGAYQGFASLPLEEYGIFLYTSCFDGLPILVLEMMLSGLVMIGPHLGGIPEAVNDECGILIDPNQTDADLVEAYVAAIERCIANPERMQRLSDAGIRRVEHQHGQAAFDQRVAAIFGAAPTPSKEGTGHG